MYKRFTNIFILLTIFIGLIILAACKSGPEAVESGKTINPSFDDDQSPVSGAPTGWTLIGSETPVKIESQYTIDGTYKLTFWLDIPYKSGISQTVAEIPEGEYTFSFWYFCSGGQNELYVELTNHGGAAIRIDIPKSSDWKQYTSSLSITSGKLDIKIYTDANKNNWVNFDLIELKPAAK